MTAPLKRYRISNLKLREISSVDRPAQAGAVAVLMKRSDGEEAEYAEVVKSATAVTRGAKPSFELLQYENAMLHRAQLLAAVKGITPEQALAQCLSTDSVLRDLAVAYEHANAASYAATITKRYGTAS